MPEPREIRDRLEGLSVRAQNAIINEWRDRPDVPLPADIAEISAREWLWHPNVGKITVADISQWLSRHGLQMPTEESEASARLEAYERAELARLKAKYEPPNA